MIFLIHQPFLKLALVTTSLLFAGSGLDLIFNKASGSNPVQIISTIGQAQAYDEQQLENYAKAVIAIEKLRQKAFKEIQTVLDSEEVPKIACNRSQSYQDLSSKARSLINNYCNRSKEIVQQQGLTVSEFNQITAKMKSSPELKQKIQEKILQLQ